MAVEMTGLDQNTMLAEAFRQAAEFVKSSHIDIVYFDLRGRRYWIGRGLSASTAMIIESMRAHHEHPSPENSQAYNYGINPEYHPYDVCEMVCHRANRDSQYKTFRFRGVICDVYPGEEDEAVYKRLMAKLETSPFHLEMLRQGKEGKTEDPMERMMAGSVATEIHNATRPIAPPPIPSIEDYLNALAAASVPGRSYRLAMDRGAFVVWKTEDGNQTRLGWRDSSALAALATAASQEQIRVNSVDPPDLPEPKPGPPADKMTLNQLFHKVKADFYGWKFTVYIRATGPNCVLTGQSDGRDSLHSAVRYAILEALS